MLSKKQNAYITINNYSSIILGQYGPTGPSCNTLLRHRDTQIFKTVYYDNPK